MTARTRQRTVIYNAEFVEWAAKYRGELFHACFADLPYGLEFMNMAWDTPSKFWPRNNEKHSNTLSRNDNLPRFCHTDTKAFQAQVQLWGQALQPLLFPGALVFMFGGTRTWHRLAAGMEDAGFEMWDTIIWLHGQGFPKGVDISKSIEKAGQDGSDWVGYKSAQLKPALEPILCFRAPRNGLTYAELAMRYGSGCLNVDGGRIGIGAKKWEKPKGGIWHKSTPGNQKMIDNPLGRYPANLILDEESACMLDAQSGTSKSHRDKKGGQLKKRRDVYRHGMQGRNGNQHGDEGGPSRFFYCAKASKSERNAGLEEFAVRTVNDGRNKRIDNPFQRGKTPRHNDHPCVKPINLCRHLATLLLPPASVAPRRLLVPFAGSGSEMIGAIQAGWDEVVGIEKDAHYCEIAEARLQSKVAKKAAA
jgi:DNA modification methylase